MDPVPALGLTLPGPGTRTLSDQAFGSIPPGPIIIGSTTGSDPSMLSIKTYVPASGVVGAFATCADALATMADNKMMFLKVCIFITWV